MNRPRLVTAPTNALEETLRALSLCMQAIEQLHKAADDPDENLVPYQRARLRHLGVAIGATVDDLQRGLTP